MLRHKLNEYNFKSPFSKAKTAIYINGKEKGKSDKAIKQDIKDYFAKRAALVDINRDRSIRHMSKHDHLFNNIVNDETFDVDFRELDDYDPYYDDFTRNNKPVDESGEYENANYKMSRKDKVLLERLVNKYSRKDIINEIRKR